MNIYKDIVINCTFLDDRENLYKEIEKLGGSYKIDFTKKVTHLITNNPNSQQYKIAIDKKIPVLTPQWIYYCSQNKNKNFNPYNAMKDYLLLPFNKFVIGIDNDLKGDDNFKYYLKIIDFLGGTYEEQLNNRCTHIISNNKVYKEIKNVTVCSEDWIFDKYLDYVFYTESKIYKDHLRIKPINENFDFFKNRTFYLSESFPEETKAKLLRIILKGKGNCSRELTNKVTTYITKEQFIDKNDKKILLQISSGVYSFLNYRWLLKCYIDKYLIPENIYEIPNSFHNSSAVGGSLFKGLTFVIHNFDTKRENTLKEFLLLQQGTLYDNKSPIENNKELLIVTSFTRPYDQSFVNQFRVKTKVITNYWVEKCLLKKKLYDIDKYPMFTPCKLKNKITGFQFLNITISGFNKLDKLYIKQLISMMGSRFTNELRTDTTLLLVRDDNLTTEKFKYAWQTNLPIISIQWLYDCYKEETFQIMENYRFN